MPADSLRGIERTTRAVVTVRDFSTKSLALESTAPLLTDQPLAIDLRHGDQTFTIYGVPKRSDRVPGRSGPPLWLTAVEVQWTTPRERSQFEAFLWSVPRSVRRA
jgi:hypothetical protein